MTLTRSLTLEIRNAQTWKRLLELGQSEIRFRNKDERLPDGTLLNVQVRTSKTGDVQLFLGVYGQAGTMVLEEAFDSRPGESMTHAMAWGFERAK